MKLTKWTTIKPQRIEIQVRRWWNPLGYFFPETQEATLLCYSDSEVFIDTNAGSIILDRTTGQRVRKNPWFLCSADPKEIEKLIWQVDQSI